MFALQSAVMLVTLPPVTPGAFRASIDWRILSSSTTQEDIIAVSDRDTAYFSFLGSETMAGLD